jgi:hypothetical protein
VVRWQRVGFSPRQKILQNREAADRLALKLQGRMREAYPDLDPDAYVCCDGAWDHCNGLTWAEQWEERSETVPPLTRLRIESRPVGEWEIVDACQPAPYPSRPTHTQLRDAGLLKREPAYAGGGFDSDLPF